MFTDSPFVLVQAEEQHRDHAVIEQFFADQAARPLAHPPSGKFAANAAWLALGGIAHNLLRAAGPWPRRSTPAPAASLSAPT